MQIGIMNREGAQVPFIITGGALPPVPLLLIRREPASRKIHVWLLAGQEEGDIPRLFENGPGQFPLIETGTLVPPDADVFLQHLLEVGQCIIIGGNLCDSGVLQSFVVDILHYGEHQK